MEVFWNRIGLAALCLVTLPAPRAISQAEANPSTTARISPVKLSHETLRRFDTAFASISDQAHITIFPEGAPIDPSLTDDQVATLEKEIATGPAKTAVVVTDVAAAFDYDVEQPQFNRFLLRKRYSNPADLPCVTYEEIVYSLKPILSSTVRYCPPMAPTATGAGPTDNPQTVFAASFSHDQMRAAVKGLSFGLLTPEQRELAMNAAAYVFLRGQQDSLRKTLDHLITLRNPLTEFTWLRIEDRDTFGYEGPFGTSGELRSFPLSNGFHAYASGSCSYAKDIVFSPAHPDPAAPTTEDDRLAPGMLADALSCITSLEKASDGVLAVTQGKHGTTSVNSAIAQKPVGVFGAQWCSYDLAVDCLAALYGLRLQIDNQSHYNITLQSFNQSSDFAGLPDEIARLMPLPLERCVHRKIDLHADRSPHKALSKSIRNEDARIKLAEAEHKAVRMRVTRDAAAAFYYPAVRRLLALVEPAVPSTRSSPVPVMKAAPEVLRLIALAMLSTDCLMDMSALADRQLP